jgi:hypothetical protein
MWEYIIRQHQILFQKCDPIKIIFLMTLFPILLVWMVSNYDISSLTKSGSELLFYMLSIWIPSFIVVYFVILFNIQKLKFAILPQYRNEFY